MAGADSCPFAIWRSMFSIRRRVIDQDAYASAIPPSVMRLIVSPTR